MLFERHLCYWKFLLAKMHSVVGATGSSKVVATLRADGSVAMEAQSLNQQLSNLLNYEIVNITTCFEVTKL